jgi:hypothetical protein
MRNFAAFRTKNLPDFQACQSRIIALDFGNRDRESNMNRSWRVPPIAIAAAALGLGAAFLIQANSASNVDADRDVMIGTWTDEEGEPGNSIRFHLVEEAFTKDVPLVKAYMGQIHFAKFHGESDADAIWNYGGWDPLVLNIVIGKRTLFATIRKIDNDHILIRIGADPEEMMRPEAINHPDTKRLTRIAREPGF